MIKKNKWKLLLSSIIILLPMIAGLLLWNHLPERMMTHWGIDGNANGWSSRLAAICLLPVFTLIVHWICIWVTAADPKNKNQNSKAFGLVIWVCPVVSLFASATMYAAALGLDFSMDIFLFASMGIMFVVIGNYLPKCKQNYTIGIKVPWALNDKENWNHTHRFAGKIWIAGGLILLASLFLPRNILPWLNPIVLLIVIIVPVCYSYLYYRKQKKEGTYTKASEDPDEKTAYSRFTKRPLGFVLIVFLLAGFLMFTGNIKVRYEDTSFTLQASYWEDLTIDYDSIDSIEYRSQDTPGTRTSGFGSPRLLMGSFQNEEFNYYTRYSYTLCDSCVVLNVDGKTLVINGSNDKQTKAIYEELLQRTGL